jgi:hypothetical protein
LIPHIGFCKTLASATPAGTPVPIPNADHRSPDTITIRRKSVPCTPNAKRQSIPEVNWMPN